MTRIEAIEALRKGKKISHSYFSLDEYVERLADGNYRFEDGVICSPTLFWHDRSDHIWDNDWYLFEL